MMVTTRTRRSVYGLAGGVLTALMAAGGEVEATPTDPAVAAVADARVEVSISARQVSLYRGGERVATYRIAVGTAEWPTRTGEWHIYQIDFNPDWNPPQDESWSADRETKAPGDPDNPMGRVRMRYDPPRSIHGTDDTESIGRAASHGSIRIRNEDGIELARMLMEASGDGRPSDWFDRVLENETEMVTVELSNPIPIRVREE
jgi:lipoprotein-anchoring transpeptidase ErfK/SrfK